MYRSHHYLTFAGASLAALLLLSASALSAKTFVYDFTIAHSVVFEAMRANVVGYKVSPLGAHQFFGVDLK